ncbi:hypothetical protein [Halalkalibacterium halodurans]|uniref:hypothetical protein n=1 Tax=Halalkalibacterium halodurans TaxID=86665 RepID=UPI002AAA0171|nr:hypothetical protein [Halalkalibacterium halodurans]MDY7224680.1 hypothetical protein [Halalkalibacterium halodurans]MDY7243270.1 hypothetical protein [Halalkalibacterium halodurans]
MSGETGHELHNQPEAFDFLTPGEQRHLTDWIKAHFKPIKTINERHTSYGLKHRFENHGGFYISNGAFKGAMLKCDFKVKDKNDLNWKFNISQKSKALQKLQY